MLPSPAASSWCRTTSDEPAESVGWGRSRADRSPDPPDSRPDAGTTAGLRNRLRAVTWRWSGSRSSLCSVAEVAAVPVRGPEFGDSACAGVSDRTEPDAPGDRGAAVTLEVPARRGDRGGPKARFRGPRRSAPGGTFFPGSPGCVGPDRTSQVWVGSERFLGDAGRPGLPAEASIQGGQRNEVGVRDTLAFGKRNARWDHESRTTRRRVGARGL